MEALKQAVRVERLREMDINRAMKVFQKFKPALVFWLRELCNS